MSEQGTVRECPNPDAQECTMMRERIVAGTNAPIPDCPIHGEWSDDETEG